MIIINSYNLTVSSQEFNYYVDDQKITKNFLENSLQNSLAVRSRSPFNGKKLVKIDKKQIDFYQLPSKYPETYLAIVHKRINSRFTHFSLAAIEQAEKQTKRAPKHHFFNRMKQVAAEQKEK